MTLKGRSPGKPMVFTIPHPKSHNPQGVQLKSEARLLYPHMEVDLMCLGPGLRGAVNRDQALIQLNVLLTERPFYLLPTNPTDPETIALN